MAGSKPYYTRCDSCGKRRDWDTTRLVAYRAAGTVRGPWLCERLCADCEQWYREAGHWAVRLLEPLEKSYRGVVLGQRRFV